MIDLLSENTYKKEKGYLFKSQMFLNNNKNIVYCLVAVKNGVIVDCLDEKFDNDFSNEYKNAIINDYLDFKGVK